MKTRIPKPPHGSAEWLAVRWKNEAGEARVSASVAAAIHDAHPYVSKTDIAVQLLAYEAPQPQEQNAAMKRGTTLEAPIRGWAAELLGVTLVEPEELFCYDEPGVRLIATLDSQDELGRVYEQKTYNKLWKGELLPYWYWQGVHQAVCADVAEITWIIFDSSLDLHFYVQKVSSDEKQIHIEAVRRFLAQIDMGMMPDDTVLEYRHAAELYPKAQGGVDNTRELGMDALVLVERLLLAKEQLANAEAAESLAKAELCDMLKDSEYGTIQDELVCTWKNGSRTTFDQKRFEKEHPALAEKYRKTTEFRTFRLVKQK
jgi:hypothetical protein